MRPKKDRSVYPAPPSSVELVLDAEDYGMHDLDVAGPLRHGTNFLDLPLELRVKVYELVFVSPKYIGSEGTQTKAFKRDLYKWRNFAFARSCRLIYEESTRVFFSKNGFMFFFHRPALEFMEAIGPTRRKLLTKLKFTFNRTVPHLALRYARSCINLKELEVVSRINVEGNPDAWWIMTFKNAKDFFLTEYEKVEFQKPYFYGERKRIDGSSLQKPTAPEFSIEYSAEPPKVYSQSLNWLHQALSKVKAEQQGHYKR